MTKRLARGKRLLFAALAALMGTGAAAGMLWVVLAAGWLAPRTEMRIRAALGIERERRVLILGDSFLSWWPIENCLHRSLAAYCRERAIGLVNTSVGGYGPYEYRDLLQKTAKEFRPQLILIFYYAGNDLTDVAYRGNEIPRSAEPEAAGLGETLLGLIEGRAQAAGPRPEDFDWEAMRRGGIDEGLIESAQRRMGEPQAPGGTFINPYLLSVALHQPDYIVDNVLIESERARTGWEKCREVMRDIFRQARAERAEVCVIAIPQTLQVSDSHEDFYRRCTFRLDERLGESTRPQELLAQLCREEGVRMIDLLPVFRGDGRQLYWENDDHLNEAGHEAAMAALRREFLDEWAGEE